MRQECVIAKSIPRFISTVTYQIDWWNYP